MKIGVRKPNIKSRVKARTTGKIKRSVRRSIDPTYGKKGAGWIKDPKKAAYNAAYSRTTIGVYPSGSSKKEGNREEFSDYSGAYDEEIQFSEPPKSMPLSATLIMLAGIVMIPVSIVSFFFKLSRGFSLLIFSFGLLCLGAAIHEEENEKKKSAIITGLVCVVLAVIVYVL
jgi:hypothetical protein